MANILLVHTATSKGFTALSTSGKVAQHFSSEEAKKHAGFLHVSIQEILHNQQLTFASIDAIAVTIGPGSYTGLRVGLSAAKGICYAANIPLITVNTLEAMALTAFQHFGDEEALYCPMIDARRMEVYTALYDAKRAVIFPPCAEILNADSLQPWSAERKIFFSGDGSLKAAPILKITADRILDIETSPFALATISEDLFLCEKFANIAYAEPLYLKEFYSPPRGH